LTILKQIIQRATAASEEGQALVEYALIIGTIALLAITSLTLMGQNIDGVLSLVASGFDGIP
jgi:Flp pilus assembly pilin Flp